MGNYSAISKLLHRAYLSNYFLSRASLEVEKELFQKKIQLLKVEQRVFISGLARSGTTAVLQALHNTGHYASLQYRNMPFLFLPNLWKNSSAIIPTERAHQDGITITSESPEALDEYFWKVYVKDRFIGKDRMDVHETDDQTLKLYETYIRLICLSKGKKRYLSKNNNLILHLNCISKLKNTRFIFLIRNPMEQGASLLKLHRKFSKDQQEDPFTLEYFNFLGHHEFGLNHKPFHLIEEIFNELSQYDPERQDYWLLIWKQYYQFLLEHLNEQMTVILFEDLILQPEKIFAFLSKKLGVNLTVPDDSFSPSGYASYSSPLLPECKRIYEVFRERVEY